MKRERDVYVPFLDLGFLYSFSPLFSLSLSLPRTFNPSAAAVLVTGDLIVIVSSFGHLR